MQRALVLQEMSDTLGQLLPNGISASLQSVYFAHQQHIKFSEKLLWALARRWAVGAQPLA